MLDLNNGLVDISDPCYKRDVWCRMNDVPVLPGKYIPIVNKQSYGIFGIRVREIKIIHEKYFEHQGRWLRLGNIGVDAGLAGFHKSPSIEYTDEEWHKFCSQRDDELLTEQFAISSTGIGDGEYPVYMLKRNKQIIGLKIEFL
jgi:hypothetical protein